MASIAQRRVSTQQVVSTRPTLSTAPTLRDQLQVLTLIRDVHLSRAVGHTVGSHTLSTSTITILVHTVKGVQDILVDHTLTTVKVVILCLQTPRTPPASLSTRALRPMHGHTLECMHPPSSSSGSQASSLHRTTMLILSVQRTLQHGPGLVLVLHHLINPRQTSSTNVCHRWDLNLDHPHLQIPQVESLLK